MKESPNPEFERMIDELFSMTHEEAIERMAKERFNSEKNKQNANRKTALVGIQELGRMKRSERHKGEIAGKIFDLEEHTQGAVDIVKKLTIEQIENLTEEQKTKLSTQIREVLKSGTEILDQLE